MTADDNRQPGASAPGCLLRMETGYSIDSNAGLKYCL